MENGVSGDAGYTFSQAGGVHPSRIGVASPRRVRGRKFRYSMLILSAAHPQYVAVIRGINRSAAQPPSPD